MYLTIILWNFRGWDIPSTGIGKLLALLKAMLFNSAYTYSSIWYLPTILIIYLFIPIYSLALYRLPLKTTLLPLGIITFFIYMRPTLNIIFPKVNSKNNIFDAVPYSISFLFYLIYLIIGYLVSQGSFKKLSSKFILFSFFSFLVASILMVMISQRNGNFYDFNYKNLFLLLMTTFAFEILSRIQIKKERMKSLFKSISKKAFGIYFIHIILMEYLFTQFDWSSFSYRSRFIIFEFGTILASYLIISLLAKNKKIAKWLFMIK